ncbi:MAG: VWA domain-containing protein [Actinobacteria bacterium]|nr:MAG: VWA domain-containing protein [Actinomycetota bacterium]
MILSRLKAGAFSLALVSLLALLATASNASAGVRLNGVDFGAYPTVGATVVTSAPSAAGPKLLENGRPVVGLQAVNLGRCKNVVLALDTSRSMAGKPLAEAAAAATAFVATKPACDRMALITFGQRAAQQGPFSSATIDADNALRNLAVGANSGTALWDAVDLSARVLASQPGGRVVVLLTDGDDVGSRTSEAAALSSLHRAGVIVYPIAFGAKADASGLERLATETGGSYHAAASSGTLSAIYSSIARELRHTWRLRYLTTARPGDKLELNASVGRLGSAQRSVTVPDRGGSSAGGTKPSPLLPSPLYGKLGDLLFTLLAGLLVLGAGILFASTMKGSWLKRRLAPHIDSTRRASKRRTGRDRLEMLSGLFRATEKAFGHRSQWRNLQLMLERADLPLRTVEFAWLLIGCSFGLGFLAAIAGSSSLVIVAMFLVGGFVPYLFVWFKAKKRVRAFEDQLPDLLITMAASLKAGHSFKQGIQSVVDEGQEPAAKELRRVITDTQLGRPMDEALYETAERIGSKNFAFVITAVTIQRQVGGSLAGLFDMVADTVRDRQQFARKIRSLTAMGRASAYVLVGLPFFIALALTVLNPTYMDPLYHSHAGHMLMMFGVTMMAFGSLLLKKIVSFKG